jgi:hypothetical protein
MARWIAGAVKHPGIEKRKAKRNGISTHAQLERDAKSSDPHVRGRGVLGLRFERGLGHRRTIAHGSK